MEDKINRKFSRRDFLKVAGIGSTAVLVSACAPELLTPTKDPGATQLKTPSGKAVTPKPVPTVSYKGRKLCFVLWDHQLAKYDFQPRNLNSPVPETCPLYSGASNPVTPAWEAYWKGILHVCNPGMDAASFEQAWTSLVASNRAFTNGSGPDTGQFAIHSITCGGATHEMVTGIPDGPHIEIYTLNGKKRPPPIPTKPEQIDMTRHFFATTGSNVRLPDGSYAVYGFPQFENCIVPLVSPADTDMIDQSRVMTVYDLQKPYNP